MFDLSLRKSGKYPSVSFIIGTFLIILVTFVVGYTISQRLIRPVTRENGLIVHLDVGLMHDMLNAQLRGKSLEEIRSFLAGRHDEGLAQAQVALASDLIRPDASSVFGIILIGPERRMILGGNAFVTGGNVPERDVLRGRKSPSYEKMMPEPPEFINSPSDRGERRPPYMGFRRSEGPGLFLTIDMLVQYTRDVMRYKPPQPVKRRPCFVVVPIAETPYVIFSRRPEPLPPEIPVSSMVLSTAVLLFLMILATLTIILPIERRVRHIAKVCMRVTDGDYEARCCDKHKDFIGHLASDVDDMTTSIERHLNQQKSLLQAVSHEIRTPLARIRFTIAMIDIPEDDPKGEERIESIDDDLTEIDNMLKELSYFNYVDAGKGREHFEENSIQEMIDAALRQRSMQLEPFEVRVEGVTEDMLIMVDLTAFKRVVGNLLSNAARYAKNNIAIKVRRVTDNHVEMFEVAVEDDGIGIPQDKRETVFEPFVSVDPSRSKSIGGVGLGLAICHRIMRIHRGRIFVEDSPLGGARMVTLWPIHQNI